MTVRVPPSYAHSQALSVVASFAKFTITEDASVAAPTAGDASGFAAASRAVVSLHKDRSKQLLCDGVDDFVALADSIFDGADPAPALGRLQAQLDGASYLLNNSLTLADVVVFLALHPTILSQSGRDDIVDVIRWAIQIQEVVASPLPPITPPISIPWGTAAPSQPKAKAAAAPQAADAAKGKKAAAPPPEPEDKFALIDVRVAQIVRVWPHPKADTLYCEEIDVGGGQIKRVVTGVRNFIPIDQMENRRCVVFVNIRPGKIRDEPSDAMVFAASDAGHTKVELLVPPPDTPIGTRVTCGDFVTVPTPPVDKNGRAWKAVAECLTVNADRVACYKGIPLAVAEGPITVETLPNCSFH